MSTSSGGGVPSNRPGDLRRTTLASDHDRDQVCGLLSQAFSQGRLTSTDLDDRTTRALAARTHGDLDDVLTGLVAAPTPTAWTQPAPPSVWPKVLFWVVAFFSSPFIFFGSVMLLGVEGWGAKMFGLILLLVVVPGLVALFRRAHPRR